MQRPRKHQVHCPNLLATVLRDGGRSSPVNITRLWFDGCEMSSDANFKVGERIKVVIRGMGSIDAHVAAAAEGTLSAHFIEECPV